MKDSGRQAPIPDVRITNMGRYWSPERNCLPRHLSVHLHHPVHSHLSIHLCYLKGRAR